jgi:hypothetical protein
LRDNISNLHRKKAVFWGITYEKPPNILIKDTYQALIRVAMMVMVANMLFISIFSLPIPLTDNPSVYVQVSDDPEREDNLLDFMMEGDLEQQAPSPLEEEHQAGKFAFKVDKFVPVQLEMRLSGIEKWRAYRSQFLIIPSKPHLERPAQPPEA